MLPSRHDRHLVAADGTDIAYGVCGSGLSSLVLTNGLTTDHNFWNYLRPRWSHQRRVLGWDLPGHGASGRVRSPQVARITQQADTVARLMDAEGMPSAIQIGWSTGCQVVLETYLRHPTRCRALVLLLGTAGRVLNTATLPLPSRVLEPLLRHTPQPIFGTLSRALATLAHAPGGQLLPRRLGLIGRATTVDDAASITSHLRTVDPQAVQWMALSAQEHSAWEMLPSIDVPVLIVTGDRDPFAPSDPVGLRMHALIPRSELVRLPEGTHTALFDHAQHIGDAVDAFLRRRLSEAA